MRQTSIRVYPRPDQEFKKKDSLDFMTSRSAIYQKRPHGTMIHFWSWVAFAIMGIVTGVVTFFFELFVQLIVEYRWVAVQTVLNNGDSLVYGWLVFFSICTAVGGASVVLTVFLSPAAAGGGGAECMGYFNGVNYPDIFSIETFIVKFFGLTFSVASALCIGKEGVLGHMGSIIGIMILYIPFFPFFKYFRNNNDKRAIAAAGQAAGVAAAFGAPIGGTLYAYEMTYPAVFWNFELAWQVFFAAVLSDFAESICDALKDHDPPNITNAGAIKFGTYDPNPYTIQDLGFFLMMGVFGGLLGAFFVSVNYFMGKLRKQYIGTSRAKKIFETVVFVAVTSTVCYFAPSWMDNPCLQTLNSNMPEVQTYQLGGIINLRYECPELEYNQLATLLFNTQGNAFKIFLSNNIYLNFGSLIIYFLIWYGFAIITLGLSVPMGLFVSGILMGCSFGRIWALFLSQYVLPGLHPGSYALIGASAILAGYARHTFSLSVIMLECSNQINMFVPVVFTVLVAYVTAGLYNRSIYIIGVRLKNIPFLVPEIPHRSEKVTAEMMMKCPVRTLKTIATVEQIKQAMQMPIIHGIPIVDENKCLVGLISRESLMVLVGNKAWIERDFNSRFEETMMKYCKNIAAIENRFSLNKDNANAAQQHHRTTGHIPRNLKGSNLGAIKEEQDEDAEQSLQPKSNLVKQSQSDEEDESDDQSSVRDSIKESEEKKEDIKKTEEEDDDHCYLDLEDLDKVKLTWEDFNANFDSSCPPYAEIAEIVKVYYDKKIDLRPYMITRPFRVFENDTIQNVNELIRHMDLRTIPVVREADHALVGVITRQDIFSYMSI